MKKCSKCGEIKALSEFNKHNEGAGGLRPDCKECQRIYRKKYRAANREKLKLSDRAYALANPEKVNEIKRRWATNNPDKIKETGRKHREANPEKIKARHRKYSQENAVKINAYIRKSYAINPTPKVNAMLKWRRNNPEKYKESYLKASRKARSTPEGKLNNMMGRDIWTALKEKKAGRKWESLVGYTLNQLKRHLEKQFTDGMTWENQGKFWHVDHIVPRTAFNFTEAEHNDFRRCWALKNLRPLKAHDNLHKYNKLEKPFQPSFAM